MITKKYFMKSILLLISSVCFFSFHPYAQKDIPKEIATVLDDIKAYRRQEQKTDSSTRHPLGSFTEASMLKRYEFYKRIAEKINSIDTGSISFDDEVNLELLRHDILDQVSTYEYKGYLNPILSDEGFHTSLARRGNIIFNSKKDADQYLISLKDVPRFVDEHLQLMRKGLAAGISQPKIILAGYEATYDQHITNDVSTSVFWKPFSKLPAGISEQDWDSLQIAARMIIKNDVISSYKKIKAFFEEDYYPKTRLTLGASFFPNGKAFYEDRVRHYTTTNLSADEVFRIGEQEVARIRAAMDEVIRNVQFKGSFKDFVLFLRSDPKFYPTSAEQLLKEAAWIAKKADGKLPSLFGKLPRLPYTVAPVPDYLAPTYTTGRYSGASIHGKRAGEYWVNTYNLPARTLYTLEALTLHEAVPGHHLQICLTQELDSLPEFRRNLYINAFGEGWGLYSEYLGHEMGFYRDPYSLFGRLTYEMWRACRLVIDVGIHSKNWTREQAVSFLADNTALSLHEVNTEINRYISWPGQALAYKIGEIKIKELRKKAENALKGNFDVRAFHDMVLSRGSVTLSLLEKMTDRFIAEELKKRETKNP
jgi:uncharacterized protein (DUF885 family)